MNWAEADLIRFSQEDDVNAILPNRSKNSGFAKDAFHPGSPPTPWINQMREKPLTQSSREERAGFLEKSKISRARRQPFSTSLRIRAGCSPSTLLSCQTLSSLLPRLNPKKILITLVRQGKNTPIPRWGLEISRQLRSAKLSPQASFLRRQEPTCGTV